MSYIIVSEENVVRVLCGGDHYTLSNEDGKLRITTEASVALYVITEDGEEGVIESVGEWVDINIHEEEA